MTQPIFQELLTSQEARDRVEPFHPRVNGGPYWMNRLGSILKFNEEDVNLKAIWQGWLTEAEPPPEPRVFKSVGYFNVFEGSGFSHVAYYDRQAADFASKEAQSKRLACVRVEITATEGQFDD